MISPAPQGGRATTTGTRRARTGHIVQLGAGALGCSLLNNAAHDVRHERRDRREALLLHHERRQPGPPDTNALSSTQVTSPKRA